MNIIVAADDFGLTHTNTDTILDVVDAGAVGQISILANGDAVDYALQAYEARKDRVLLNLHANLTEGPSLSGHAAIPLLTDKIGHFKYSVAGLGVAYTLGGPARRAAFRNQVRTELDAQRARIGGMDMAIRIDGHQHVHMLPFVFDTILAAGPVSHIRIPRESWHAWSIWSLISSIPRLAPFCTLQLCAIRNGRRAARMSVAHPDAFVGVLYSGRMTYQSSAAGLAHVAHGSHSVEILLHPGSAASCSELSAWSGGRANLSWHLDPARAREYALLLSRPFAELIARAQNASVDYGFSPWRLVRYGISGGASAAANLVLLYGLTEWFHIWYLWSAVVGFAASMIVSFVLQKFWTFTDRAHSVSTAGQLSAYLVLDLVNLGVNTTLLYVLVTVFGIWYLLAGFITLAVLAIESYYVLNYFVFAPHRTTPE